MSVRSADLYFFRTECRRIKDEVIADAKGQVTDYAKKKHSYAECAAKADQLAVNAFADFGIKISKHFNIKCYSELVPAQIEKEKTSLTLSLMEELLDIISLSDCELEENDERESAENSLSSDSDMDLDEPDGVKKKFFPNYDTSSSEE